jgi:hypothetical protein
MPERAAAERGASRRRPATSGGCRLVLAAALLALALPTTTSAQAVGIEPGFEVLSARTRAESGVLLLDAEIHFGFSDEALEAMRNGVPLTISVEMQVLRERRGPDKRIALIRARFRLKTHALSKQFVITNLGSGEASTFASFEEMRSALGRIVDFPLVDRALLPPDGSYRARLRARLDIEALPAPLRPLAYLSPSWRLKSDWYGWRLNL